ncbi:hypothetical protein OTK49_00815 [Vibrio coralliirubri]|uniref:hypothetical protein n=1 Tax=Vibrio coralliirubri TaxID=1516159 RepID=UPI002283E986|nr:hypothetical protein [Vibrio coralliirubri]MCY9861072.1 hypothetical protein [Vibrio coralliirubri]
MTYEQSTYESIKMLLTFGVIFSFLQLLVSMKTKQYRAHLTSLILVLTVSISCLAAGLDNANFSAYEQIRGLGYFYSDMFIDGVDSTEHLTIADVVALKPVVVSISLVVWVLLSLFCACVLSCAVYVVLGIVGMAREEPIPDAVFFTALPFMIMLSGSLILFLDKDFQTGALSDKHRFHQLNFSIPSNELQALHVSCPSGAALYSNSKLICEGETVVRKRSSFLADKHKLFVVVWSDDLQKQKVMLRAYGDNISSLPSMAEVTSDAEEVITLLNRLLLREVSETLSKPIRELEWQESELLPNRK